MKIYGTPFVSRLSGSAGDATAATVRGVNYARRRVTPANPQTAAQTTQRGHFARQAPWWRSLPGGLEDLIKSIASGSALTGFNLFARVNLRDLANADPPHFTNGFAACEPVADVADAGGAAPDTLAVEITQGGAEDDDYVLPFTIPVDPSEAGLEEPDRVTFHDGEVDTVTNVATNDLALPVENAGKDYYVILVVADLGDPAAASEISAGVAAEITSGA